MENAPHTAPLIRESRSPMGLYPAPDMLPPQAVAEPLRAGVAHVLVSLWETLSQALLVIDRNATLVHANALGRRSLADGRALRLVDQCVAAASAYDRDRWRCAIGRALRGVPQCVEIETGAGACVVTVAPAPSEGCECMENVLVVFIGPAKIGDPFRLDAVARHYRLTAAEVRVLRPLLDDMSPKDMGALLDVATSTIRTHIRHLLQKTGTTGMRGLVSLVARFPVGLMSASQESTGPTTLPDELQGSGPPQR